MNDDTAGYRLIRPWCRAGTVPGTEIPVGKSVGRLCQLAMYFLAFARDRDSVGR